MRTVVAVAQYRQNSKSLVDAVDALLDGSSSTGTLDISICHRGSTEADTTRAEMISLFHSMYLDNIAKATQRKGKLGTIRVDGDELKQIFNETIADFGEAVIEKSHALAS